MTRLFLLADVVGERLKCLGNQPRQLYTCRLMHRRPDSPASQATKHVQTII
jgi:hypothetical protein